MNLQRIRAVIRARNREFYRDKAGLGWNLAMPFIMLLGFAFIFSGSDQGMFKVGVLGGQSAAESPFLALQHIRFVPIDERRAGIDKVRYHRLDLLFEPGDPPRYWVNEQSPNGYLAERLLRSAYGGNPTLFREAVSGRTGCSRACWP